MGLEQQALVIAFPAQLDPGSQGGQELIAHELTHVVQQTGISAQRKIAPAPQRNVAAMEQGRLQTKAPKDRIQRTKLTNNVTKFDDNFRKNLLVLSGHGVYVKHILENSKVKEPAMASVPGSTTVTMWSPHGTALSDWYGGQVERGDNFSNMVQFYKQNNHQMFVYESGDTIPNYHLVPGKGLTLQVGTKIFTPERPYTLRELMDKFNGKNLHWAACRSVKDSSFAFDNLYKGSYASDATTVDPKLLDTSQKSMMTKDKMKYIQEVLLGNDEDNKKFKKFFKETYKPKKLKSKGKSKRMTVSQLTSKQASKAPYEWPMSEKRKAYAILENRTEQWVKLLNKLKSQDSNMFQTVDVTEMQVDGNYSELYQQISNAHADWPEIASVAEAEEKWKKLNVELQEAASRRQNTTDNPYPMLDDNFKAATDSLSDRESAWGHLLFEVYMEDDAFLGQIYQNGDTTWDWGADRTQVINSIQTYLNTHQADDVSDELNNVRNEEQTWQNVDVNLQNKALDYFGSKKVQVEICPGEYL